MNDLIPGTSALMAVEVGVARTRPSWSLPTINAPHDLQPNAVLIVTGIDSGDGRSGYVNLLASTLLIMGRPIAIVEFALSPSSAGRAHKAEGVPVDLVSPIDPNWASALIDCVDDHFDRTVIVSVRWDAWLPFASIEEALLENCGSSRAVAFIFVDPSGEAKRLKKHEAWLSDRGRPALKHLLVLRGSRRYPPVAPPMAAYYQVTTVPFFEEQVARAVFERAKPAGQPQEYATFHAAWAKATSGTRSLMFKQVGEAMRDIVQLIAAAGYRLEREVK